MATQFSLGSGLGRFFNALSDGDAIKNSAYNEQTRQNLTDQELQGKVNDQRLSDQAYQEMPRDLETIGVPAGQGNAYAKIARATGSKMNELGDLFKVATQQSYIKGAQDAMNKGNTLGMNFGLSAGGEKPLEMTKVADNTSYNPNVAPDAQTMATTPYGTADLLHKAAQDARTTSKVIPLSTTGLKAFALAPDANNPFAEGIDTGRYSHFQEWAEDKGMNDLNAALPKFLKQEDQVRQNLTAVLQQARTAIKQGIPAQKVRSRLEHLGVKDQDLAKAGL